MAWQCVTLVCKNEQGQCATCQPIGSQYYELNLTLKKFVKVENYIK